MEFLSRDTRLQGNPGRDEMQSRHNVFRVHEIPPGIYFGKENCKGRANTDVPAGPRIGCAVSDTFSGLISSIGNVSQQGLWDEMVDEPIAYPFVAGNAGMCYIPQYEVESPYDEPKVETVRPVQKIPVKECKMTCQWND